MELWWPWAVAWLAAEEKLWLKVAERCKERLWSRVGSKPAAAPEEAVGVGLRKQNLVESGLLRSAVIRESQMVGA